MFPVWRDGSSIPASLITNEKEKGTDILFIAPARHLDLDHSYHYSGPLADPDDENAIVVGNFLLRFIPGPKVGDWLTIKIDGKETKWQIVGIYMTTVDTGTRCSM